MSLFEIIGFFITLPARLKGAKIGRGSYLAPGYDFLFVNLSGVTIGKNVQIGRRAWLQCTGQGQIIIGDGTHIGRDATISCEGRISVGKRCLFSYRTSLLDHDHNFSTNDLMTSGVTEPKAIVIGDGCFIGAQSSILKGVTLGENCIVGANSVVTKSFPSNTIIGGVPARAIGKRTIVGAPA